MTCAIASYRGSIAYWMELATRRSQTWLVSSSSSNFKHSILVTWIRSASALNYPTTTISWTRGSSSSIFTPEMSHLRWYRIRVACRWINFKTSLHVMRYLAKPSLGTTRNRRSRCLGGTSKSLTKGIHPIRWAMEISADRQWLLHISKIRSITLFSSKCQLIWAMSLPLWNLKFIIFPIDL